MKKRIGAALLAASLGLSLVLPISAAGPVSEGEAAEVVGALNIMVGDENGNLNLDRDVKRAEFITMAVKASTMGDQVGEASTSPYPDVPRKHWAAGFVQAGVQMGLISGYLDGTFRPDNKITLAEGATIVLKLLGYTGSDFSGAYPTAQMTLYHSLGLDEGLQARNSSDVLDRRDSMYLFYNLLSAKNKNGQYHLNTLGYSLNAAGEVDRVALVNQVMDGPVVTGGDWQSQIPFDVSKAAVTRDGRAASLEEIGSNELVYWNEGMRRLWVYNDRVTGMIQDIAPNAASPASVTVAGRTYSIETDAVTYALSDLGEYRLGDTVTVLVGRNGGAAALEKPVSGEQSKVGIVTALNKSNYSSGAGNSYAADTITILATDGKNYSYPWNTRYYEVGDLVQVVTAADGSVSMKRLSNVKLTGKISADGRSLGKYTLAENVEILDTYEDMGIPIYASRLAGVQMKEGMVRYYSLNPQGEIDRLILKEATGDMHRYGVMTKVTDLSMGMNILVHYEMELEGQSTVLTSQGIKYAVDNGPFVMKGNPSKPDKIYSLKSVDVSLVEGNVVTAGNRSYTMSDTVQVYEYRDGEYYLSNLDRVDIGTHELTAWYDKLQSEGGRVRVIIAKEK